ncbi:MAG: hypothetical protein AUI47_06175 [Acidobacteria bacterium 13_1_40CM_2_68_5]|nr:MAG: hypothetical protein AUI47_06175 [Acidobacteria bacterium 13_1_40CM_2_68_5]
MPRVVGFGHNSRPGEPMLPIKVLLVAIPEGATPALRVLSARAEALGPFDVAPVPTLRVPERLEHPRGASRRDAASVRPAGPGSIQEYDEDSVRDEKIYGRDADFPAAPVRLGRTGYLREQRYVEVLYSPLVFNSARKWARFFPDVQVEILFGDAIAGAIVRPSRPDPLFEEIYRQSLVNYEQGKLFRVGPGEAVGTMSAAPRIGGTDLASAGGSQPAGTASAAAGRYKLSVSQAGVYRLDYTYLQTNAPDLLQVDPGTLALSAEGVEIPISIQAAGGGSGELDGRFDTGDFLEFYGRPKSGPFALINYNYPDTFPDVFQANDFTDTQVYWLTSSGAPGSHRRTPAVSGAPQGSPPPIATDFEDTAVFDENNLLLPLDDNDPFYSIPSLLADSSQSTRDISLPLPGKAPATYTSTVTVRLRGGSSFDVNPDHRTIVWINNDTAGGANFPWDGEVIWVQSFPEPQSVLTNPTTIHFSLPGIAGVSLDHQYIDTVGDALTFSYPNQDVRFQVGGFSAAAPVIYEATRTLAGSPEADPVRITDAAVSGAPTTTFTFDVPRDASAGAPAVRTFAVLGPAAIRRPDAIGRAADPVLHDPTNGADIVVIAARSAVDASTGGALDNLLAFRASAQGLTSKVVFIDQIYDEFSDGLRDPNAIRTFLSYAFDNWKGPSGTARSPAFVLLVGDATSDYKNTLLRGDWVDQVPSQIMFARNSIFGYYASDNWLASFRGADQIPDVLLGRISTRTPAASAGVFDKIRRYEQSPPPGLWKGHVVLLAGDDKQPGNGDSVLFESIQNRLAATYFSASPYSLARSSASCNPGRPSCRTSGTGRSRPWVRPHSSRARTPRA